MGGWGGRRQRGTAKKRNRIEWNGIGRPERWELGRGVPKGFRVEEKVGEGFCGAKMGRRGEGVGDRG